MKKVFAILSVLALTIALVGVFGHSTAVKADEKFTVDPTLSENEIPMYIMDSIYTTFPQYYDNEAEPDDKWAGPSRMYPWNETRLQFRQMDSDGKFTGKEYAVYYAGSLSGSEAGTGNNLLFYNVDESGNPVLARMNGGKWGGGGAMDPSLSHMRTNISGQDITFSPKVLFAESSSEGDTFYNRLLVFDADGRVIRGLMGGVAYMAEGADGANETVFAPEYCYVDGVVTKAEDGVVCDKIKEAQVDENGDPVIDETTGDPVLVETDKDNYLYTRFLWQWVSAEAYDADQVNDVPYLSEGWDATKWDYANYEESSDGYVLICFLPSENSSIALTADQIAVYTNAGLEAPATRTCAQDITVPAGGFSYDFGYLDKGKTNLYNCFVDMFTSGYYYGRNVDEEGKGAAYQKTFDFSAKPLYTTNVVANGVSYAVMPGQNTIEVLQGEVVYPCKNVVYTGLAKYWQTPNDLTSFKSDTTVLDMYIVIDGVTMVEPSSGYTSFEGMVADWVNDWNAYADEKELSHVETPVTTQTDAEIVDKFYNPLGWDFAGLSASAESFLAKSWAKWGWLYGYINQMLSAGGSTYAFYEDGHVDSPGTIRDILWAFFAESPKRSISGTWANTQVDFDGGKARGWLDARTNLEKWQQCAIDTSTAAVDTNYKVEFKVVNQTTGISSTLAVKYVVIDEYTPLLEVNKNNLLINQVGGAIPTIDPYTFCTAYNGKYNGSSIKGDDISYKVHYESETLDFEAPTEGTHKVVATIYSASGAKFVQKSFNVVIEDLTAPRVLTRDLTLAYGSYWEPSMGITFAYDAVDGNLMNNDFRGWLTAMSSANTAKPGKYTVECEVSDRSGNVTTAKYTVTVLEQPASKSDVAGLSDLADQVANLASKLDELQGSVDKLAKEVEDVKAAVGNVDTKVAAANAKKCGSKSAILIEFLAAASLLGVFLKKRH